MRWNVLLEHAGPLLDGLWVTVATALLALVASLLLGMLLAGLRVAPLRPLQALAAGYVTFLQNVPPLIAVLFAYYALPSFGLALPAFAAGVLGLSVYSAAFMAEAFRSGVLAVPEDNWLACRSVGMSFMVTLRRVVLPQAAVYALPPLTNQSVRVVKNTSLLALIAGGDVLYYATQVASSTFAVFEVYTAIAVAYLILTIPLARASAAVEKRIGWRSAQLERT